MKRTLREQTVVITGASSGIGRETALEFGQRGATVVLAARNELALNEVASDIAKAGGRAFPIVTDVAEWDQVRNLAEQAAQRCGRIDTWVNNAGVSEYATVEAMSVDEIERIIQVDLFGPIYGMKAVLPIMKRQGQGTIINIASVLAERSVPLQSAYCAAKQGLKGFTESLRMELEHAGTDISVTLIEPASINTPFFSHARSRMGVRPKPLPPVYEPHLVAEAILFAAEHSRRDIMVGGAGKVIQWMEKISPALADKMMAQGEMGIKGQLTDQPDDHKDILFAPQPESGQVRGEFGDKARRSSLYTRIFELHPAVKVALLATTIAGAAAAITRHRHLAHRG